MTKQKRPYKETLSAATVIKGHFFGERKMPTEREKALPRLQKIWDAGGTIHFDFVPGHPQEKYYEQVNLALDAMEDGELTDPEPHDWDDSHA